MYLQLAILHTLSLGHSCSMRSSFATGGCYSPMCDAGRESLLDEDYTEEQADQELAPLNAQLAYVNALSAQQEAALSIYQVQLSTLNHIWTRLLGFGRMKMSCCETTSLCLPAEKSTKLQRAG